MIEEKDSRYVFLSIMKANNIDLEDVKSMEVKLSQKVTLYGDYILSTKPISCEIEYFDGNKENIDFKRAKEFREVLWNYYYKIEDMGFDTYFTLHCELLGLFKKYKWIRTWFKYFIIDKKDWKWVIKNKNYF